MILLAEILEISILADARDLLAWLKARYAYQLQIADYPPSLARPWCQYEQINSNLPHHSTMEVSASSPEGG